MSQQPLRQAGQLPSWARGKQAAANYKCLSIHILSNSMYGPSDSSGAGKTTLLDVIAGYKTGGRITGDLTLSGLPKDRKMWQLLSGYAEQSDLLNPYLTVLETLKFTASCRLPASMNRMSVIIKVLDLMKLEDWVDVVVGVEIDGEGIPKHVRKRLTIAVQLVMLPKILFLDVSCYP